MNTEFDNREKPAQLIAAAVAVLVTGLIIGAFQPVSQLIPSADAAVISAQSTTTVQRMDAIVVTAKRA